MLCFKRFSCLFLALVILFTWPGFLPQEADAVGVGAIVGATAIAATAVASATLINLGLSPKADTAAWDNAVSGLVDHFKSLGYVVDGMIQVAKFKPTDDVEDLKAAIAMDVVGVVAQWVDDSGILVPGNPSILVDSTYTFYETTFNIYKSSAPVYALPYQVWWKWSNGYYSSIAFYSSAPFSVEPDSLSWKKSENFYLASSGSVHEFSKSPFAYVTVSGFAENSFDELSALIGNFSDGYTTESDIDVSSVPANFTDIAAAYPDWVASGADYAGTTYLPISISIPGGITIPTTPPTEVTEATEATEPGETTPIIVTPGILEGMFGGLRGWLESILAAILAAIQSIPEKIDAFGESLSTWWTEAIADAKAWIEVKIQSIADWWTLFWADTIAAVKALGLTVTEFFTVTFPAWITDVKAWAVALPQTIIDAILAALAAAFVPAAGYWDAKITACKEAFPLFNSIIITGQGLGGFFSGLGARPPIIYIDLGNSASWAIGGTQKFLDLTWYAQYKPTVDIILSGFLWLLFAWRFFLRLPGLLRGEGGTIDRLNTYFNSKSTKDGE